MWSVRRSGVIVITLVFVLLVGWYALRVLLRPGPGCVITAPDGSTLRVPKTPSVQVRAVMFCVLNGWGSSR